MSGWMLFVIQHCIILPTTPECGVIKVATTPPAVSPAGNPELLTVLHVTEDTQIRNTTGARDGFK